MYVYIHALRGNGQETRAELGPEPRRASWEGADPDAAREIVPETQSTIRHHPPFRNKGFTVSTSTHNIDEVKQSQNYCDYVFVSPIFDSISKSGYLANKDF